MIYLDNAATSFPKPKGMIDKMVQCMTEYCGNPGRSGHSMSMKTAEEIYKARQSISELLGISNPEHLIFTNNTTMALNMGMKGILKSGDHVVTTSMEHNSVLRPLREMETIGITHTIVTADKSGILQVGNLRRAITENTRLIVSTQASNITGTIMPIEEIGKMLVAINRERAEDKKILFMVDAAQGAGHQEINVLRMRIDLLALPGHKGMLGPLGTGALYVRKGLDLIPLMEGGTGTASKDTRQPREFPEGFESGSVNAPGIIGWGYSAQFIKNISVQQIAAHERDLIRHLEHELRNMHNVQVCGPEAAELKTGVVLFNIDGLSCEETAGRLSRGYDIAVRGGYHCAGCAHETIGTGDTGGVRISVGPFNTKAHMNAAIEAIYRISGAVR